MRRGNILEVCAGFHPEVVKVNVKTAASGEGNCPSFIVPLLSFPPTAHAHPYPGKAEESKAEMEQRNLHPFGDKGTAPGFPSRTGVT